jgi:hypothetical protein
VSAGEAGADPYQLLAELAEAELALCETGRPEEMAALYAEAERIVAGLPAQAPTDAAPWLQRAAEAQERIAALLDGGLAAAGGDFEQLRRRREATRSYAAAADARVR